MSDKIFLHNECAGIILLNDTHKKQLKQFSDYNFHRARYIESFKMNSSFVNTFLNNLRFIQYSNVDAYNDKDKSCSTLIASGTNNICIIYDCNTDDSVYVGLFCPIDRKLIEKIHKNLSNDTLDIFFQYHFCNDYNDDWLQYFSNNNIFFLVPNMKKSKITYKELYSVIESLKNKSDLSIYKNLIMDMEFTAYIKCDNYDTVRNMFKNGLNDKLYDIIRNSNYTSVYNLNYSHVTVFKNIRDGIISFFTNYFNIPKEFIAINIPILEITNIWISIYVHFRDIYQGNYKYVRLVSSSKLIDIDDLILILESLKKKDSIDEYFKHKYHISIGEHQINNYSLNSNCWNFQGEPKKKNYLTNDINKGLFNEDNFSYVYNNNNIVHNNKFTNDYQLIRITSSKNSRVSSLCQLSLCIKINDNYYVIIISPRTNQYMYYKTINDPLFDPIKFLKNNNQIYPHKGVQEFIEETVNNNLLYLVEIINIDPYDCSGCNDITTNNITNMYIKKFIIPSLMDSSFMILYENHKITKYLNYSLKESFTMVLFILIHNLIRNALIMYSNNIIDITQFQNILEIIIASEYGYHQKTKSDDNFYQFLFYKSFGYVSDKIPSIGKYTIGSPFINDILNNSYITIPDDHEKCPFICIPDESFIKTGYDKDFKFLIWYTYPNIDIFNKLLNVVNNIYYNCVSNDNYLINNNNKKSFSLIHINETRFKEIYDINDIKMNSIKNKFIYGINSIIKPKNFIIKNKLESFIDKVRLKYNVEKYSFLSFHYPTGDETNVLHLHLYIKYTQYTSSFGYLARVAPTVGYRSNYSHELTNHYSYDYINFKENIWNKKHSVVLQIICINKFVNALSKNDNLPIETIYDQLHKNNIIGPLKKKYVNIIKKFLYMCMESKIIRDYMCHYKYNKSGEKYFRKLINYNFNTIITYFYGLFKRTYL